MYRTTFVILLLIILGGCKANNELTLTKSQNVEKTKIYLVRHAEKLKVKSRDPKLSFKGEMRAKKLADMLEGEEIDVIYSTQYKRTQMTAAPIASLKKLQIQTYSLPPELLANKLFTLHKDQTVLVVGHSNTVPKIIKGLGVKDEVFIDHQQYGDLFIVELLGDDMKFTITRFGD